MKQKSTNITLALFQTLTFGSVIGVVALIGHPFALHKSPVSPVATSPTVAVSKAKPGATVSEQASAVTVAKATVKPAITLASLSPKQEQIEQSITTEYTYHIFGAVNDPKAVTDWTLTTDDAPAAWDISTGNNQTIVADIDSGFALNHQDLVNQWYQNPGETGMTKAGDHCWTGTPANKATNNCDDDGNGYIDDWRGWNFVKSDNNPQAGRTNPTGSGVEHGTETAGFIGASGNNGFGSSAINQHTKIMPLQALSDDGTGYTSGIASAIYYAVDNGAGVINMSLGTYSNDPALKAALDYATAHNVVTVAAAGNCGDGSESDCPSIGAIGYPAAYPDVIAVGATTQSGTRASFSSYGSALDVSAPGYNLPVSTGWSSTNQTSLYESSLYGTSFSSPQVASLASLIKSIRPSTSVTDVTALIDATASKPPAMNGLAYTTQFGHGVIDAGSALKIAQILDGSPASVPVLLQDGSALDEHETPASTPLGSGCQTTIGSACTIQFTDQTSGNKRYLPYTIVTSSGSVGWSWSSDILDTDPWNIRAYRGDSISNTPYMLFKLGT